MNVPKNILALVFLFGFVSIIAQEDLMDLLEENMEDEPIEVAYTFKATRIINSHTIERMVKRQLDFRVNHRFGQVNSGYENFWGLDNALISLDFGYGISDKVMVGLRRSTFNKTVDGSLKVTLFRQTTGARNIPVAISYYTNLAVNGMPKGSDSMLDSAFSYRMAFTHQFLIARKFNEELSLQLMPVFIHRNLVDHDEENNIISIGIGGRYKISRRIALTGEYFWASHTSANKGFYNPLSFGIDWETGGHVFQLFFTNTQLMEESGFISQTRSSWLDGGVYFGFNISRVFAIGGAAH